MNQSPDLNDRDVERQLSALLRAPDFKRLCHLGHELAESRTFNLFRLADKTISENAWSRLFSWLLNSSEDHRLGLSPFQQWLRVGFDNKSAVARFGRHAHSTLTTNESPTLGGRRLDIVVQILDQDLRLTGIIGIENKVWSGELPHQIRDYQSDLDVRYPTERYPQ
jgi:PD-(D/E)XK nuclease superfamily